MEKKVLVFLFHAVLCELEIAFEANDCPFRFPSWIPMTRQQQKSDWCEKTVTWYTSSTTSLLVDPAELFEAAAIRFRSVPALSDVSFLHSTDCCQFVGFCGYNMSSEIQPYIYDPESDEDEDCVEQQPLVICT